MDNANLEFRDHLPEGWRSLFDELLANLSKPDPSFRIVQAKEKFGELRVYLEHYGPGTTELIDAATRQSKKTCQICGGPAALRVYRGLYRTLCEEHRGRFLLPKSQPIALRLRATGDGIEKVDV